MMFRPPYLYLSWFLRLLLRLACGKLQVASARIISSDYVSNPVPKESTHSLFTSNYSNVQSCRGTGHSVTDPGQQS